MGIILFVLALIVALTIAGLALQATVRAFAGRRRRRVRDGALGRQ